MKVTRLAPVFNIKDKPRRKKTKADFKGYVPPNNGA